MLRKVFKAIKNICGRVSSMELPGTSSTCGRMKCHLRVCLRGRASGSVCCSRQRVAQLEERCSALLEEARNVLREAIEARALAEAQRIALEVEIKAARLEAEMWRKRVERMLLNSIDTHDLKENSIEVEKLEPTCSGCPGCSLDLLLPVSAL